MGQYMRPVKQSKVSAHVANWENALRLVKGEASKIAAGGVCVPVDVQLNDGNKLAIGATGNVPAYVLGATAIPGQIGVTIAVGTGVAADFVNNCPNAGNTISVDTILIPGAILADYPLSAQPGTPKAFLVE